jgi:glutamine cyclotransferase
LWICYAVAEGITVVDDKIYLLTWREKALMTFDATTLEVRINKTTE